MNNLLFVYGTLLLPRNPFAFYLAQNCTHLSAAKVKGLLYDIGEYPGLILSSANDSYVNGSIYTLNNPTENLKIIDEYEGFGPGQEQPNLYIRTLISVETAVSLVEAWIYLYNLPVDGLPIITSGNYAEYIKTKIPR